MNRRDFGKMVVGSGVAAAVPASGLAASATSAASRGKYIFAVALAHARTDISADMISEQFGIRPHIAQHYLVKLVRNGVVEAPNAQGIARLAEPLQRIVPQVVEHNPAGGYIVRGRLDEWTAKAKKAADKLLEAETDAPEEAPAPSPSADDPAPPEASDAAHSAG